MTRDLKKLLLVVAGGALVAVIFVAATRSGRTPNNAGANLSGPPTTNELEVFLRARAQILDIEQQVRAVQKHPNAEAKPEVMQRLYDQANAAIIKVLEAEGMTLRRYNDLQRQMQNDQSMLKRAQKVLHRMERQTQGKDAPGPAAEATDTTTAATPNAD